MLEYLGWTDSQQQECCEREDLIEADSITTVFFQVAIRAT